MTNYTPDVAHAEFPKLLERVEAGESIQITESGRTVALLIPPGQSGESEAPRPDVAEAVKAMLEWRDRFGPRLGEGCTIRELIEEGRR